MVKIFAFIPSQNWLTAIGFVQNALQRNLIFFWQTQHAPIKCNRIAEADYQYAFAMLRHKVCAVDYFAMNVVAQLFAQGFF